MESFITEPPGKRSPTHDLIWYGMVAKKVMPKPKFRLYFLGSKITADGDCSCEIKRCSLLGMKVMTNLDSILKSRDITLPTKAI